MTGNFKMYIVNNNRLSDKVISETPYNVCASEGSCGIDNSLNTGLNTNSCARCGNDPNLCTCKKNQSPVNVIFNLNSHNIEDNSQQSPVLRPSMITPQVINPTLVRPDRVTPILATNYDINSTSQNVLPTSAVKQNKITKQNKLIRIPFPEQQIKRRCDEEFYEEFL